MNLVLVLILSLSVGGFAYEAAYSDLAAAVKRLFAIEQPFKYNALTYYKFWSEFLGKNTAKFFALLILPLILFRVIHSWIYKLVSCPYCMSIYMMFAVCFFALNLGWLMSLLFAPLALISVAVIDKLRL